MVVNLKDLLKDENNEIYRLPDTGKEATLGDLYSMALKFVPKDEKLQIQKVERWSLLKKVKNSDTIELNQGEKELLKKWVDVTYPCPVLAGKLTELLGE